MLVDLDELVLKCRDERAKAYISEAVACYKSGAYRASIIATWIAVAFDIVDKIYELSIGSDAAAIKFVEEIEHFIDASDLPRALKFERRLLEMAFKDFEFISVQEYTDLDRLQHDRHRCAHPTRTSLTEVFSPTAELARVHIRTAVEALLQHQPAQGKAALERLLRDVSSELFPAARAEAFAYLNKSALSRARPSLVRNFVVVMLKASLDAKASYQQRKSFRCGISCVLEMYPQQSRAVIRSELTKLIRSCAEQDLAFALALLLIGPDVHSVLEVDQMTRMTQFVRQLPADELDDLDQVAAIPWLSHAAIYRAGIAGPQDFETSPLLGFMMPKLILNRVVNAYCGASSFDEANRWAKLLSMQADAISSVQVRTVLLAAAKNDQITGSFRWKPLLASIAKENKGLPEDFEQLVAAIDGRGEVGSAQPPGEGDYVPF